MGGNLISWMSKKQGMISFPLQKLSIFQLLNSSQLLWIRNQLVDYEIHEANIPIFCNNNTDISLSKNPTLHSRAKHIEIKHHFTRDHVQKGTIDLQFVSIDERLTYIFTNPLVEQHCKYLREILGMILIEGCKISIGLNSLHQKF